MKIYKFTKDIKTIPKDKLEEQRSPSLFEKLMPVSEDFGKRNALTCRSCKHRLRYELSPFSQKIVQCCELQPSKRSNSGYKTIKVTDLACINYEDDLEKEMI